MGVGMTKLESYGVEDEFTCAQFLAEVDRHPDSVNLKLGLEERGCSRARSGC